MNETDRLHVAHILGILTILLFLYGCATTSSTEYKARPFFLPEEQVTTHGKKDWIDHLVELDPGHVSSTVAPDFQVAPPLRIAVLPFTDLGSGNVVVDKVPFPFRDADAKARWGWTYSNRMRKAFAGDLATREFVLVPLPYVDAVLKKNNITNLNKLDAVGAMEIGKLMSADAVVYGEVLNYEAYYGFLLAAWQISAQVKMVSTKDGHELFSCIDSRYDTSFTPAFDPLDIAINSTLNLLQFRDVELARTEFEVGREMVLQIPIASVNIKKFAGE